MLVLDDKYFLFSVGFFVFFMLNGLVLGLSFAVSSILSIFLSVSSTDENKDRFSFSSVSEFAQSTSVTLFYLGSNVFVHVLKTFWGIFPFLVLLIALAIVNSNSEFILQMFEDTYNIFFVKTEFVKSIRGSAWVAKVSAEVLVPIWNYILDTVAKIFINLALFFSSHDVTRRDIGVIVQSSGVAVTEMSTAVVSWINTMQACRFENWEDTLATDATSVACLDFRHREFDAERSFIALQAVGVALVNIMKNVCPIAGDVLQLATYPLQDHTLSRAVNTYLNVILQLIFDIWDVTALRCKASIALGYGNILCVPDVAPLFVHLQGLLEATGALMDNWLETANDFMLSIIMQKQTEDASWVGPRMLSAGDQATAFGDREVRVVPISPTLTAYTDGTDVLYDAPTGNGRTMAREAFSPAVRLDYGLAKVSFLETPDELDYAGSSYNSIMGCNCIDNAAEGMRIVCSVAHYSRTRMFSTSERELSTEIPVVFEVPTARKFLRCASVQVSVQPVRFPQISNDISDDREEFRGTGADTATSCARDHTRCNNIDALVFVKPLCRGKRRNQEGAYIEDATYNRDRMACTSDFDFQPCYPYCVGARFKNQGNYFITLYGKNTIERGLWKTDTHCVKSLQTEGVSTDLLQMQEMLPLSSEIQNLSLTTTWNQTYTLPQCSYKKNLLTVQTALQDGGDADVRIDFAAATAAPDAFELGELQPFAFAGDSMLVPKCSMSAGACVWTASLHRMTSSVQGQYRMVSVLRSIPAEYASTIKGGWQTDDSTHSNMIRIPYSSMTGVGARNLAAQSRTGIFYAVNVDVDTICAKYTNCRDSQATTELCDPAQFRGARLFLTRPRFECNRGSVGRSRSFVDAVQVRACTTDLTREVVFSGDDAFFSSTNLDGLFANRLTANLFIRDLVLFDELNLLVTVVHGPISNILFETGQVAKQDFQACYDANPASSIRYYFVHVRTLAVRRDRPWAVEGIKTQERLVPDVASTLALYLNAVLEGVKLVTNEYVLNLLGIMDKSYGQSTQLNQGTGLRHSVYDGRTELALSTKDVMAQFSVFSAQLDRSALKAIRYLGVFAGLDVTLVHWSHSGALSLFYAANAGAMEFFYLLHYLYDDLLLRFIYKQIRSENQGTGVGWLRIILNNLYDSIVNGRLRNTVFKPFSMICNRLPHLTMDSNGALGAFVFHACNAVGEIPYTAVTIGSTLVTFTDLNTCICQAQGASVYFVDEAIQRCVDSLPESLQIEYEAYWAQASNRNEFGTLSSGLCRKNIQAFRAHLMHLPDRMLNHMHRALEALKNIPSSLVNNAGLLQTTEGMWTCSQGSSTVSSQATLLVPRPISFFERCAYTKTCQQKCSLDIAQFFLERAQALSPDAQFTSGYNSRVPVTTERVTGLSEEADFTPLAVQDYGGDIDPGCDRYIVVVGRPFQTSYSVSNNPMLRLYRLCYHVSDTDGLSRVRMMGKSVALQDTQHFMFYSDADGSEDDRTENQQKMHQIMSIMLPHQLPAAVTGTVLIAAWSKELAYNGVFAVNVLHSGAQTSQWVLYSVDFALTPQYFCDVLKLATEDMALDPEFARVEFEQDSTAPSFTRNPAFLSLDLMPEGETGAPREQFSLMLSFVMYVDDSPDNVVVSASTSKRAEFIVFASLRFRGEEWETSQCSAEAYSAAHDPTDTKSLSALFRLKNVQTKDFILEEFAHADQCSPESFHFCRRFGLATFDTVGEDIVKTSNIIQFVNGSAHVLLLRDVVDASSCSDPFCESARQHATMTIKYDFNTLQHMLGRDVIRFIPFRRESPYEFRRYGGHALRLAPARERDKIRFFFLRTEVSRRSSELQWLMENRVERDEGEWSVASEDGLTYARDITVSGRCEYMRCGECSGKALQRACRAAEECAVQQCVGTVMNTNNFFCVIGSLMSEVVDFLVVDARVMWSGFVGFYITLFDFTQSKTQSTAIHIEALSDFYVSGMCETKDVVAAVSAVIPSLIYTVYDMSVEKIRQSPRVTRAQEESISPQAQLSTRTVVTFATEMINQVLLVYVYLIFVPQKVILCAADNIAELSGGLVNIVRTNIGGEDTDMCRFNIGSKVQAGFKSDADVVHEFMQMDSVALQVQGQTSVQRDANGMLMGVATSFATAGPTAKVLSMRKSFKRYKFLQKGNGLKKYVVMNNLNGALDWAIGVLFSISRMMSAFEPVDCRPTPRMIQGVTGCVCQDARYGINAVAAAERMQDGAFWCSGVLRISDARGVVRYMLQPLSFATLRGELDAETGFNVMNTYLECVSTNGRDCAMVFDTLPSAEVYQRWLSGGVNPLAVLTRCRENFAGKSWDSGIFAVYNNEVTDTGASSSGAGATTAELEMLRGMLTSELLGQETVTCLMMGPLERNINSCMMLFYEHKAAQGAGTGVQDYFKYIKTHEAGSVHASDPNAAGADACEYLSSPVFLSSASYGGALQECAASERALCSASDAAPKCTVDFSTRTMQSTEASNVVRYYKTEADSSAQERDDQFAEIRRCVTSYLDAHLDTLMSTAEQNPFMNIDYSLETFEGDLLHQHVDCIFLGAYNATRILPADQFQQVEQLMYSRSVDGSSRRFEMPCEEKIMTKADGSLHAVNTCGTPARISAVAYVTDFLRTQTDINAKVRAAFIQHLTRIRGQFDNLANYRCRDPCCDPLHRLVAKCPELNVADYDPDIDINTKVTIEFLFDDIRGHDIQYKALTDLQVRVCVYICVHVLSWASTLCIQCGFEVLENGVLAGVCRGGGLQQM